MSSSAATNQRIRPSVPILSVLAQRGRRHDRPSRRRRRRWRSRSSDRFTGRWNVVTHRNAVRRGPFPTLHDLSPRLRSEFVAIQDPTTVSHPGRVAAAVGLLVAHGAEILAAPLQTPSGIVRPGNRAAPIGQVPGFADACLPPRIAPGYGWHRAGSDGC